MPVTGRKKKPSTLRDHYSINDIEGYEYTELRETLAQDELAELFDEGDLGYAKWDGSTGQPADFRAGYYLFRLR